MGVKDLNQIFNPKRIAVIGASEREGSVGAQILHNLLTSGYEGKVYPINPYRTMVQGIRAYPAIAKVPEKVDLAIIATPAHLVPQIVEECGLAQILGIIIVSAGFREAGTTELELEQKIREFQTKYSLRLLGPNSFGVIRPKINLFATFADKHTIPGKIAFISQSGALCASVLDWAWENQVGFSAIVSTGSMLDIDLGDLIDYFGTDPHTKTLMLYVESIKNPRKFMSAVRQVAREKPIILVKAGRFKETGQATLSHSGALAGEDAVYDAAFKRAGIVRVETISELCNCAVALSSQPNPNGVNLTIVSNAGGPAIMAADQLVAHGGKLTHLTDHTVQMLKEALPPYCSVKNPVDIYEEAPLARFKKVLDVCIKDQNSDGFLVIYTPQGASDPILLAQSITELATNVGKPVLVALMSEDDKCREAKRLLQQSGVPTFSIPERAVSTFINMYNRTLNLELLYQKPQEITVGEVNVQLLKSIIRQAFSEGRPVLSLDESMRFLEEYKIPIVKTLVAKSPQEAQTFAAELGYPVVMKALSPQLTHKSKFEGVVLNVCSANETALLFDELAQKVKQSSVSLEFQGVAIQPMVRGNAEELLIGAKKDPHFGSVIVFGRGGIFAEYFKNPTLGFPPLNQVLAHRIIDDSGVLNGNKGNVINVPILEEILVKFSHLVTDFPEIKEFDINPLVMTSKTTVAVDARAVIEWDRVMREYADHNDQVLIATYPKEYIATRRLKDDTEVILRPIKAEDEERFNDLVQSLTPRSMRFRFFQIIKEMPHSTLTKYCNLDYDRQIALVAQLRNGDGNQILGAGRVIAEPGGSSGEFAVLVTDHWQRKGLGSILMDEIITIARNMRLASLFAEILSDNTGMIEVSKKKGFKIEPLDEETVKASLVLSY